MQRKVYSPLALVGMELKLDIYGEFELREVFTMAAGAEIADGDENRIGTWRAQEREKEKASAKALVRLIVVCCLPAVPPEVHLIALLLRAYAVHLTCCWHAVHTNVKFSSHYTAGIDITVARVDVDAVLCMMRSLC